MADRDVLLNLIPYGRENAISRGELRELTGENDRKLRAEIKELIRQGHPILSSSAAKGYWRSDDIGEIEAFLRESARRRRTEERTVAPLARIVEERRVL